MLQPHGLAPGHVCGYEFHTEQSRPYGDGRARSARYGIIRRTPRRRPVDTRQALPRNRSCSGAHDGAHSNSEHAAQRRQAAHHSIPPHHKAHLLSAQIQGRCHSPVLLCRRADHVLDLHHPVRHTHIHGAGHGREGCRGAIAAVQHLRHDTVLLKPLHMHIPSEILPSWGSSRHPRRGSRASHARSNILQRHSRALLPCRRVGMHVTDVPYHLRHCARRYGRGCQVRSRRPHHGDPRRIGAPASPGINQYRRQ